MSDYAWIIDTDHIADDVIPKQEGRIGPRGVRGTTKADLASAYPNRHQFRMYDDDGELYYTGTLFWQGGEAPAEHQAYGPLGDFGMPGSGCTAIKYTGKPDWDCG